jgi:hypothetical protein
MYLEESEAYTMFFNLSIVCVSGVLSASDSKEPSAASAKEES